jgi:hypothetical protein
MIQPSQLLRRALLADAIFSELSASAAIIPTRVKTSPATSIGTRLLPE